MRTPFVPWWSAFVTADRWARSPWTPRHGGEVAVSPLRLALRAAWMGAPSPEAAAGYAPRRLGPRARRRSRVSGRAGCGQPGPGRERSAGHGRKRAWFPAFGGAGAGRQPVVARDASRGEWC